MSRLDDILRERYETGSHGDVFITISRETWKAIPKKKRDVVNDLSDIDKLSNLLGIPVVINEDLKLNEWNLVNIKTKEVIETGTMQVGS